MNDPSSTSFIPKRSPQKRVKRSASRQVYVFTLISYTLIFAALLASLGVYIYLQILERNEFEAVTNLDSAIKSFVAADMERVLEFDNRLNMATERVNNLASVRSILLALEEATAQSVQIIDLSLSRLKDSSIEIEAKLITDNFDSALFQRGIYDGQGSINSFEASELAIEREVVSQEGTVITDIEIEEVVSLVGDMTFNLSDVLFDPNSNEEIFNILDSADNEEFFLVDEGEFSGDGSLESNEEDNNQSL